MKTKRLVLVLVLLVSFGLAACKEKRPSVPPLSVDLPVSFKSDSIAYNFILHQVEVWNEFGNKIETMYRQGEKFKKKNFKSLSQRQLFKLLKLDLEYAMLWGAQNVYADNMVAEAELAIRDSSPQGSAKITETQAQIMEYFVQLVRHFGTDLQLDQEPIDPNSLLDNKLEYSDLSVQDSLLRQFIPDPLTLRDSLPESGTR